jgi:hypothetical protein
VSGAKALVRHIASTEGAKEATTVAAIGALVAVPVPVIGPVGGAVGGVLAYGAVQAVSKVGESVGNAAAGMLGRKSKRRKRVSNKVKPK